jgi:chromosome segregation ATPase
MNRKQRRHLRAIGMKLKIGKTLQEIQAQYAEACSKAGDLQYRIAIMRKEIASFEKQLDSVNDDLQELNKAYSQLTAQRPAAESLSPQPEANNGEPSTEGATAPAEDVPSVPPAEEQAS